MASALEYLVLGREQDELGDSRCMLLLFNGALPSHDPYFYTRIIDLEPMTDESGVGQPALALLEYDGPQRLLVAAQPADEAESFNDHFVFIPISAVAESALQFEDWLGLLPEATGDINVTLPSLPPPDFNPSDSQTRAHHLQAMLDQYARDGFESLLSILGAVIDERQLIISGFPLDFRLRLAFISAIQALLPGRLASCITFASHRPVKCHSSPQIVFSEDAAPDPTLNADEEAALALDWREDRIISEAADHPYLDVLRLVWSGDAAELAADIQRMAVAEPLAARPADLSAELRGLAERFWVDRHVRSGDEVATEVLIAILEGSDAPGKNLRRLYIEKLLRNALNNRDATAGRWVAEALEKDAELEAALFAQFDELLEEQPDAIYVFIRNRFIHLGVDAAWLPHLHHAARKSLEVAIQEGDVGTLAGWLELIAHEPHGYQLQQILRDSILAAAKRAYSDGELGIQLILIAARRVPDIVDTLYEDQALVTALDFNVRAALQNASTETLDALIDEKPEFFLLALFHGVNTSDQLLVSAASTRKLLSLASAKRRAALPAVYRAPALIRHLATQASHQLTDEALDILFAHVIDGDDRQLMAETVRHLADHELLFPRLGDTLERDSLPLDKVLSIMNAAGSANKAAPQAVIDTYFDLLDYYQWEPQTQRLMEALTRVMAKHHDARVSYRHLWTLFGACQELQVEGPARVAIAQLLTQFSSEADLKLVVDGLTRICGQIGFSDSLQKAVNNWWREYTHDCAMPQLQRLQRELDGQRHMEAQKHILMTVLAMRRWLHSRGPAELTEAINSAYIMLEHITEAFDVAHLAETDPRTIRREVDVLSRELSAQQRHILANNLRNLALRITQMAERRSKPSLIRSDDTIDRQLTHGEANPQGSVDMLKWIAGYLDGAHPQNPD